MHRLFEFVNDHTRTQPRGETHSQGTKLESGMK